MHAHTTLAVGTAISLRQSGALNTKTSVHMHTNTTLADVILHDQSLHVCYKYRNRKSHLIDGYIPQHQWMYIYPEFLAS